MLYPEQSKCVYAVNSMYLNEALANWGYYFVKENFKDFMTAAEILYKLENTSLHLS